MSSRSWNRVELIGNLTRDPELRYTPQGTAVCSFSIATNRTFISDGEKKEEADFHRIVAWSKLGELCSQLLKKGNRVFVSGRLQNRSWTGQDGAQRQTTEIVIEDMILPTSKNGTGYDSPSDMPEPNFSSPKPKAAEPEEAPEPTPEEETPKSKASKEDQEEKPEAAAPQNEDKPLSSGNEDPGNLDDLPF